MKSLLCIFSLLLHSLAWAGPAGSLFTPKMKWKNDSGKIVQLQDLKGQWVILAMMYTSCQASCPLIVQKMRKLETLVTQHGKKTDFLLITFDPKRDTPAKLKAYRAKIGVDEAHWHFWSGSEGDTRKLSMLLGMKYAQDPESGEFMHDNQIILMRPDGTIAHKLQTLGEDPLGIIQAIQ